MYLVYSILLAFGFLVMLPAFLLRREKYAAGFSQRLGNYPAFEHNGRPVIWLHCVSVGETNAARPLVDSLKENFPGHRLVVSTTTKTGQELAQKIFAEKADAVIYFPFDFKFSVRRALSRLQPSLVLLMETEIWPRFIREAKLAGAKVAIVNGRLSERSVSRYRFVRPFILRVLKDLDLALMQGPNDTNRLISLGMPSSKTVDIDNLKFDIGLTQNETEITDSLKKQFAIKGDRPLIIAASTHEPEERFLLEAYCSLANGAISPRPRLLIAPRHPQRFDQVALMIEMFRNNPMCEWRNYMFTRRSSNENRNADVILLDTIGELRAAYPLAYIVFVGGSLVPHGGQSILEPAAVGRAIITGPYTHNFAEAVEVFLNHNALIQLPARTEAATVDELHSTLCDLLEDRDRPRELGRNAMSVMKANRGATARTIGELRELMSGITDN